MHENMLLPHYTQNAVLEELAECYLENILFAFKLYTDTHLKAGSMCYLNSIPHIAFVCSVGLHPRSQVCFATLISIGTILSISVNFESQ